MQRHMTSKNTGHTREERTFIALMRLWMALFAIAALLFAAIPHELTGRITSIGESLIGPRAIPLAPDGSHFWVVLAVALLFSLSYTCAIVQKNLIRNIGYTRPLLLAKLTSSLGFLICFISSGHQFVYFVGTLVDGAIFLLTLTLYRRAVRSRV